MRDNITAANANGVTYLPSSLHTDYLQQMLPLIPTRPTDPYASPMHCLAFGTWLQSVYHRNEGPLSSSDVLGLLDSVHLPPEEGKIDKATEIEYCAVQTTRRRPGLNSKRYV